MRTALDQDFALWLLYLDRTTEVPASPQPARGALNEVPPLLQVHVSNLAQVKITNGPHGVVEEFELGDYFYNHGCAVKRVRLMVDGRTRKSRGFAFVDFGDEESVQKAVALDGVHQYSEVRVKEGTRLKITRQKRPEYANPKERAAAAAGHRSRSRSRSRSTRDDLRAASSSKRRASWSGSAPPPPPRPPPPRPPLFGPTPPATPPPAHLIGSRARAGGQ